MVGCSVFSCKHRSEISNFTHNGVSYYSFPKDPYLRKEWVTFCQRSVHWVPKRTSVICSDHFDPLSFENNSEQRRRLRADSAKPTIVIKPKIQSDCTISEFHNTSPRDEKYVILLEQPADEQNATLIDHGLSPDYVLPSTSATQSQIPEPPKMKKLRKQLALAKVKVKRLQAKNRYLENKVKNMEDFLEMLNQN